MNNFRIKTVAIVTAMCLAMSPVSAFAAASTTTEVKQTEQQKISWRKRILFGVDKFVKRYLGLCTCVLACQYLIYVSMQIEEQNRQEIEERNRQEIEERNRQEIEERNRLRSEFRGLLSAKLADSKELSLGEKFFKEKREAAWRQVPVDSVTDKELEEMVRELIPVNDQRDDYGNYSLPFVDYLFEEYNRYSELDINGKTLLKKVVTAMYNIKDDPSKKDDLDAMKAVANSHQNHCITRLADIVATMSAQLDAASEIDTNVGESTEESVESSILTAYRRELVEKSTSEICGLVLATAQTQGQTETFARESVMLKAKLTFWYGGALGVEHVHSCFENSRIQGELPSEQRITDVLARKFDLRDLGNIGEAELKRLPDAIFEQYRDVCMQAPVTAADYCRFSGRELGEFRNQMNAFLAGVEVDDKESQQAHRDLANWAKGEGTMTFNAIRDNAYNLDSMCEKSPGLLPELIRRTEDTHSEQYYVANVLMPANMFRNGTFIK